MDKEKNKSISPSTILGIVLCVIFIPIIVINLILILGSYIHPEVLPGVFGFKPAVVLSGSMEPAIQPGDLILIREADTADLGEGDVICYLSSGKAVTHRIVGVATGADGETRYITQGDANNAQDSLPVSAEQIQGVWNGARVGGLGNFILFMQTPVGMVIFIVCPLLLFALWDMWQRRRMDRAEAARTAELEAELAALKSGRETEKDEEAASTR